MRARQDARSFIRDASTGWGVESPSRAAVPAGESGVGRHGLGGDGCGSVIVPFVRRRTRCRWGRGCVDGGGGWWQLAGCVGKPGEGGGGW